LKRDERKSQAAVEEMGELIRECWTKITEPVLPFGFLGTGDLIVNFQKQTRIFEYWLEIKVIWLPKICVTPLKWSGLLLRTSEKCLKHI